MRAWPPGTRRQIGIGIEGGVAFMHCEKASMRWSLWYSDRWPDVSGLAFAAAGRNVPVRVFNISAISFPATPCRHPFTHAERATRNNRRQNGFDRVLGAPTWPMSTQFSIS